MKLRNDVRRSLAEVYKETQEDIALQYLRRGTRFVPGEGCEWFPLVVFVGEAPGAEEEETGRPFVGRSGRLLRAAMAQAGFSEDNCFITNLVKFRPPNNRNPATREAEAGARYASRELAILSPEVVVPLGSHALQGLLPHLGQSITAAQGKLIQEGWRSYFPMVHPAYALRRQQSVYEYSKPLLRLKAILG